jgi:predicted nuclease of predicted toxin-antitoxin system
MKIQLDENLGRQVAKLLSDPGHDVQTVPDQHLCAATDGDLIQACRTECRCLVSLDLDFGNPLLFAPTEYAGIVVLRLPRKCSPDDILGTVETLLRALSREDPVGKLWIVQKGRIRVYQDPKND